MGCECTKVATTNKVSPIDDSTNRSNTLLSDDSTGQHNTRFAGVNLREPERIRSASSNKHSISSQNDISPNDSMEIDIGSQLNESLVEETIAALPVAVNKHVDIVDADPDAFRSVFVKERQNAIDNRIYRSTIESWRPNSLQQLSQSIQNLSKKKSPIECHWMIFYWIACNIEYDVVSYFSDNIPTQSVEEVFRTRKGVCAGYSHLYQYLCDRLDIKCQEINGYSKGYGYDQQEEGASLEKDHAWNAVQINDQWYLIDSTWGAGTLTESKIFKRELNCYYFLAPPHQMIYHHLPEDDKWQLLRTTINMTQYIQMPKIRPAYFHLNLELISPLHQAHVALVPEKSYALVLLRTPADVDISGSLKLNDNTIEGGHQIVYDVERHLYRCYFAPSTMGRHKVELYAKKNDSTTKSYDQVLDLTLTMKGPPQRLISYPKTWKTFYDLGLKAISPVNTHLIKVSHGMTHARVLIRAPPDVVLMGKLKGIDGREIEGGGQVYCGDRRTSLWKCKFAPDRDGLFEATIYAKKQTDPDNYSSVLEFKVEANQISLPPLSYPQTWQLFHDLNLRVKAPQNCSRVPWPEHASYVEVLIRASNDVELSCDIRFNGVITENGSLAQFDSKKMMWRLLFAPRCTGEHELFIFAKRNNEEKPGSAIKFHLNATNLPRPLKLPMTYGKFQEKRCQIYEPLDGVLKKGAKVPIHYSIPGAADVKLKVDSTWLPTEGYQHPILKQDITVGSKEVAIFAKYGEGSNYDGLVHYTVQ